METTDGVLVFVFIGRESNPSSYNGPLPSHLIWLGCVFVLPIINSAPSTNSRVPKFLGAVVCHNSNWLRFAADTNNHCASQKPRAHHRIKYCSLDHAAGRLLRQQSSCRH